MKFNKYFIRAHFFLLLLSLTSCDKEPVKAREPKPQEPVLAEESLSSQQIENKEVISTETITCEPPVNEPSIAELQRAAIRYAEVEPEKISRWRKQTARKALLPQVNVGIDRNTTDLWHWEGGSTVKTDDDILRRGHDSIDWDVTLSWDLGDLIYNDDQTSIDSRSKLMVQLRNDVLGYLNAAYFERKKLQRQLDKLTDKISNTCLEREIRIEELTATIDGLTGGYLSSKVRQGVRSALSF